MALSAEQEMQQTDIPERLPLLPVRDIVVFPHMVLPLFVGREISVQAIETALAGNRMILMATQKSLEVENPEPKDIYSVGTVAMIMRMLKLPDGRIKVLIQGLTKAKIVEYIQKKPFFEVKVKKITELRYSGEMVEIEALMRNAKEQLEKMITLGKILLPDIMVVIENIEDPGRLSDMIISNLGLKPEQAQKVLELLSPIDRLKRVNEILAKEMEVIDMQHKIQSEAKGEMDRLQREYFLREQMRAIQKELGDEDDRAEEINEFNKRIKTAKMPKAVFKEAEKQLRRLEKMHPDSAESSTVRTYLECLVELPWSKKTKDNLNIKSASKVLNEDHYGLDKVKERILEYLGVRKLKGKMKGPILCFVGPPGVGKTSLGRSIARAMGRKFIRISLGGVRDEAEIRGHRRTYVGALPGRIIQGIKQAGSNNPVFMMDEIDKIGADFRGDPAAALLEVLDPEQNNMFADHYLGVPFDLSNVMFITTANIMDPIPSALRDRMEVIPLSGYTEDEKVGIAQNYLMPRQLEEHGITEKHVQLSEASLHQMIFQYTREAGVRNLEREIANVFRKVGRKIAEGEKGFFNITPKNLHKYLGVPKYLPEIEQDKDTVGVATGLAWTEAGGDIIYIEATLMKGKGTLTLTGHLGNVMKESAQAALSYIRSISKSLSIPTEAFSKKDLHIHVPAGAIPKDGPSAGITMATVMASVFTGRPVKMEVAMTGEITLRGRVLPIGGLKEKILAAKRAGLKTVIIPSQNKKDLDDVPKNVKRELRFICAETMETVLSEALVSPKPAKVKGARMSRKYLQRRAKPLASAVTVSKRP